MTDMSRIWDGETHWLEPDDLFCSEGSTLVIRELEELDEEEDLSPFEPPSRTAILIETRNIEDDPRFPNARAEQSWGALSIALTAFANIAEIDKKQFQHVWPGIGAVKDKVKWSFTTNEHITERM